MTKLQIMPIALQKATGLSNLSSAANGGCCGQRAACRRHQRASAARHRHNATQTPDVGLSWSQLHPGGCPHSAPICCYCKSNNNSSCCALGNGELSAGELTCHCHITHHCHHYSPGSAGGGGDGSHRRREQRSKRRKQGEQRGRSNRSHYHLHHQHGDHHNHHLHQRHQQLHQNQHVRQLPTYNSKSSFDSSDDQQQQLSDALNHRHHRTPHLQQIAIDIDAATMTEDNTSTATSNFAYKMAADHVPAPIIRAPLHDEPGELSMQRMRHRHRQRCDSLNSNTTVETDELSRDNEEDDEEAENELTSRRSGNDNNDDNAELTPRASCCDNATHCYAHAHNECVKIKRKRFIAAASQECCSSCSRCSSCSCHNARTSSCSSLDELDADDVAVGVTPHALLVVADCHRCNLQRQSTTSTGEDDGGEEAEHVAVHGSEAKRSRMPQPKPLLQETTTDSSAAGSRRSSESFCSCHSTSCYFCSCDCDDCDTTGQLRTARDSSMKAVASAELDEPHSSTLTPLTNPSSMVSTPLVDDADVTLRSLSHVLVDDGSSLSQSAEYFSLSSSNQPSQATPTITPTHKAPAKAAPAITVGDACQSGCPVAVTGNRKPCKHYSKHHRHKHVSPPLDAYL